LQLPLECRLVQQMPPQLPTRAKWSREIIMRLNLNTFRKAAMRTTPNTDDHFLAATKLTVRKEGATSERIEPHTLRNSLTEATHVQCAPVRRRLVVSGFRAFPAQPGVIVTNDQINALRDA
jgi:hypothetical protein